MSSESDSNEDDNNTADELVRKAYRNMTTGEQENFDQEKWNKRQLLSLDPEKVYQLSDLEDKTILARSLRLLYMARFGRDRLYSRISPHIKYDKLPAALSKAITEKLELDELKI